MSRQTKELNKRQSQDHSAVNVISTVAAFDDFTDGGGTDGTLDLSEDLPDGAWVLGTRLRVLQAFDQTTTVNIGTSSAAGRFAGATPDVTSTGEKDMGDPSGQREIDGATTPRVTLIEASDFTNVSQGNLHVQVFYIEA